VIANSSFTCPVTPAKAGVQLIFCGLWMAGSVVKGSGTPDQVRGDDVVREAAE
jgi:hypothetical protein